MKTSNKKIYRIEDIRPQVIKAIDRLVDPIRGTMSPKGANVIFTDDMGGVYHTNDGYTIAKNINVYDPIESTVMDIVKFASLKTNSEAGDGTSTTALLSQVLLKEGFKKIDDGMNVINLKDEFLKSGEKIIANLQKFKKEVKGPKDLEYIATVSSNNDPVIAKNVVRAVKITGESGLVFIEPNHKNETELIEDIGFNIKAGLFSPELLHKGPSVSYDNPIVLVTDKRLYYYEEAATIIKVAQDHGYKSVVVVAQDFLGEALNTFIANHAQGVMDVLLVKEPNAANDMGVRLNDISVYLDGDVVTDKKGSLVDNLTIDNFMQAKTVFSDEHKTIITPKKRVNPGLSMHVANLTKQLEKKDKDERLEERIASLTTGMVTIKVGGATVIEVNEKIYRYEDAVNATKSASKHGYLVGGGLSLYKAFNEGEHKLSSVFKKFCQANLVQITENCGKHTESILEKIDEAPKDFGYNANTDKVENLLKVGIIDPYKVTEMAVRNSISVVNTILSSGYIIVNDIENYDKEENSKTRREV